MATEAAMNATLVEHILLAVAMATASRAPLQCYIIFVPIATTAARLRQKRRPDKTPDSFD